MKKSDLKKIIAVTAVIAAAAAGTAVYVAMSRKKKEEDAEKSFMLAHSNAYILGGGMSALASALYLVRDCGMSPSNVHVFTDRHYTRGNADTGYICRRGKIIDEKKSGNFFDLIQEVRSLDIPDLTVLDEILNIYTARGISRPVTFVDEQGDVIDISQIRIDKAHRHIILGLMREKKEKLLSLSIEAALPFDFFNTHFWKLMRAAYGFDENSSAYEFVNALSHIDEILCGTMPSDFDRYEEIIEPLTAHLEKLGVDICKNARVTDIDFEDGHADAIHYTDSGVRKTVYTNSEDICIFPTDEMAECETLGSFNESAPKGFGKPYELWERIAEKHGAFGNPSALFGEYDENMSVEFTITLSNRLLPELIDRVTCDAFGQDGIIVLDNSPWKMTICAVPPSHFKDQNDDMAIIWGTAARFDLDGEKCGRAMTDCSGAEILYELVSCLNLEEAWDDIRETVVNVIPCHRRYDKTYLAPVMSKLEIIPTGISNFAISGDFADGSGSVFTEEFSVTTAKSAAYRLMNSKRKIYRSGKRPLSAVKRSLRKF